MRDKTIGIQPCQAFWICVHHTQVNHSKERLCKRPKANIWGREKASGWNAGSRAGVVTGRKRRKRCSTHINRGLNSAQAARAARPVPCEVEHASGTGECPGNSTGVGHADSGMPHFFGYPEIHRVIPVASASKCR
jgi:hypothetical protein